ncbi:MAG: DUF624 domain-containing protein [Lachnospiraceae bacterium]|nr:DUF624 domain-containing protein [Lachnospiraceae bacterium]
MHLFDINGPLMEAMRKLADIILYNLLFVIFSLPVVTAGASFAALCEGMQQLAEKELIENGVVKTFLSAFKRFFKEGTKLWFVVLAVVAVVVVAFQTMGYMPSSLASFYLITVYVIIGVCSFGLQFAFPLLVRKELTFTDAIKTSFLMGIAQFPYTLCSLGVTIVFVYITLFTKENAFYYGSFFWIAAGFGVLVYINSFFFLKAYKNIYEN